MKKIFVIGGMGSGKSSVRALLAHEGLSCIDLDGLGHEVLACAEVRQSLAAAFGSDVLTASGEVNRTVLATKAFSSESETKKLNTIMLPHIKERFEEQLNQQEAQGQQGIVVEYSAFEGREGSLIDELDVIVAVVAPVELRVQRAVNHGWIESDVRARLARQITDEQRIAEADVVFENVGSLEDLSVRVHTWWDEYSRSL